MEAKARHEFYEFIREEWGPARAGQLMDLLPPFDWSEFATKSDLRVLGAELRHEMADLRVEMHDGFRQLSETLASHTRTIVLAIVAMWISGVAFAVAAARLAA